MANAFYKSITVSHQGEYSERMRWSRVRETVGFDRTKLHVCVLETEQENSGNSPSRFFKTIDLTMGLGTKTHLLLRQLQF